MYATTFKKKKRDFWNFMILKSSHPVLADGDQWENLKLYF